MRREILLEGLKKMAANFNVKGDLTEKLTLFWDKFSTLTEFEWDYIVKRVLELDERFPTIKRIIEIKYDRFTSKEEMPNANSIANYDCLECDNTGMVTKYTVYGTSLNKFLNRLMDAWAEYVFRCDCPQGRAQNPKIAVWHKQPGFIGRDDWADNYYPKIPKYFKDGSTIVNRHEEQAVI